MAQVEAGAASIELETCNPLDIIQECATTASQLANQKNLAFYDRTVGFVLPELSIDPTRFQQVLLNLLSNAVKYNRPNGTVSLLAEEIVDGYLRISVTDSGMGIPEEKHKMLFTPFSRLGLENSDITGTGIGLTITREMTEAMGGHIGFDSKLNLGSTFWVEFPMVSGSLTRLENDGTCKNDAPEGIPIGTSHTVLCIEDDKNSLRLLETVVARIPSTLFVGAHTGELGIDLANIHHPDVIMMDINLPGMSGIDALGRLRASPTTKNIPVIALTARASPRDVSQGLEAGFDEYLTKPINVEQISSILIGIFATTKKAADTTHAAESSNVRRMNS